MPPVLLLFFQVPRRQLLQLSEALLAFGGLLQHSHSQLLGPVPLVLLVASVLQHLVRLLLPVALAPLSVVLSVQHLRLLALAHSRQQEHLAHLRLQLRVVSVHLLQEVLGLVDWRLQWIWRRRWIRRQYCKQRRRLGRWVSGAAQAGGAGAKEAGAQARLCKC